MKPCSRVFFALGLAVLPRSWAHIALWHPSLYGWVENYAIQSDADYPLQGLDFKDWWFHGWINKPPADGVFMELPAGGTFHGEVNCAKSFTTYGQGYYPLSYYACPTEGQLHTADHFGQEVPYDVRGCGLGIAYKSDVNDIQPEDFTVISTNFTCPWTREVDFQIPPDLPPCPEGGCHCMWGWIHAPWAGSEQMYHLGYRCNVTNAVGAVPLPPPQIARKCPLDKSNCTIGSKQPHYWYQNEANNNFQDPYDPPYYNGDYGFANGAQMDLFDAVASTVVYTQTSKVPVELYYTNPPPTYTGKRFTVTSSTTSTSPATTSTSSISTSVVASPTSTSTSTPPTSIASPSTATTTSLSTISTSIQSLSSNTSTQASATEIGSPTFYLSPNNASPESSGTPLNPSSTAISSPDLYLQCGNGGGGISRRAAERMRDPLLRKKHEARAQRRRLRRRAAMKDVL